MTCVVKCVVKFVPFLLFRAVTSSGVLAAPVFGEDGADAVQRLTVIGQFEQFDGGEEFDSIRRPVAQRREQARPSQDGDIVFSPVQEHGGLRDGEHGGQTAKIEEIARVVTNQHGLLVGLFDAIAGLDSFIERAIHSSFLRLTVRERMIGGLIPEA